jgi:hypothetical protein
MVVPRTRSTLLATCAAATALLVPATAAAAPATPSAPSTQAAATSLPPSASIAADFDGDGKVDLIARKPSEGGGTLYFFKGSGKLDGTSTFGPAKKIGTGFNNYVWLGAGDIDGDHKADVLGITKSGSLDGFRNTTFLFGPSLGSKQAVGTGWNGYDSWFTMDGTGDGKADMFGAGPTPGDKTKRGLYAYPNNGGFKGTGTFGARKLLASAPSTISTLGYADITGDHRPDLLLESADGTLGVYDLYGKGVDSKGHSKGATQYWLGRGWRGLQPLVIADVNSDGHPDLVGKRANGQLVAYRHVGKWNPKSPGSVFAKPVVIGSGWGDLDLIA